MGLFGSLFTGVSALNAQSQNTAIIANNIANVSTVGFKRSEAAFLSLVTTESRQARFSPGTVSTNRLQKVKEQGGIQQTSSATDVGVSGNGLIPVKRSTEGDQEFLYSRNGQFSEDSQGFFGQLCGLCAVRLACGHGGRSPRCTGGLDLSCARECLLPGRPDAPDLQRADFHQPGRRRASL